jgi:WhiB family redox-sensing transcriptional regulator
MIRPASRSLTAAPAARFERTPTAATVISPDDSWVVEALCRQTDPEAFYPDKGEPTAPAKRVCAHCPVTAECLEYALFHDERFGVWGGLSARERRHLEGR